MASGERWCCYLAEWLFSTSKQEGKRSRRGPDQLAACWTAAMVGGEHWLTSRWLCYFAWWLFSARFISKPGREHAKQARRQGYAPPPRPTHSKAGPCYGWWRALADFTLVLLPCLVAVPTVACGQWRALVLLPCLMAVLYQQARRQA